MRYVVLGATGQTGSAVADRLLDGGATVRLAVRDPAKADSWAARGCEVVRADVQDAAALAAAFDGADGVYLMNPPNPKADDPVAAARVVAEAFAQAIGQSGVPRAVLLSSIGSQVPAGTGNILTTHVLEQVLRDAAVRLTAVRAASFLDNWKAAFGRARDEGVLPSFLVPLDRAVPMVASQDIGHTCAEVLMDAAAPPVVELAGPEEYSPNDIAAACAHVIGRPVAAVPLPRDQWPAVVAAFGSIPGATRSYIEMMDAFNAGRLMFEGPPAGWRRGPTTATAAINGWKAAEPGDAAGGGA